MRTLIQRSLYLKFHRFPDCWIIGITPQYGGLNGARHELVTLMDEKSLLEAGVIHFNVMGRLCTYIVYGYQIRQILKYSQIK